MSAQADCGYCASKEARVRTLEGQLQDERTKRLTLESGVDQLVWFGEDQLDPHSDNEKIRPPARLVRALVVRAKYLLEMVRS